MLLITDLKAEFDLSAEVLLIALCASQSKDLLFAMHVTLKLESLIWTCGIGINPSQSLAILWEVLIMANDL
jgi:hypothetical protein